RCRQDAIEVRIDGFDRGVDGHDFFLNVLVVANEAAKGLLLGDPPQCLRQETCQTSGDDRRNEQPLEMEAVFEDRQARPLVADSALGQSEFLAVYPQAAV